MEFFLRKEKLQKFLIISLCILAAVLFYYFIVIEWEEEINQIVKDMGILAPLGIFILRGISTIFPVISNLPYAILAGKLLDFKTACLTIFLADFVSCQAAFWIARNLGREPVRRLVGIKAMKRIESFNQNQLEENFFLMTGLLMTGLFDFLSYAIGIGGTRWKIFSPALLISLLISDSILVAVGAGVSQGAGLFLGIALLGMFALATISGLSKRKISK